MKPYPLIPALLMIAALPLSACTKSTSSLKKQETAKHQLTTEKTTEEDTSISAPAEDKTAQENKVTIQTWDEKNCSEYSSEKDLIYKMNIKEPEVIIPDNLQAQYRLNRYLRENDFSEDEYYTFIADADDYYSSNKETENPFLGYTAKVDYTVLKNDGRILSLRRDEARYTGGAHGLGYSAFHSYDTKTGQKITLNSLTNDPDQLKLTLRQDMTNQANKQFDDPAISKSIMLTDIENFVLLSEGIQVYYNTYELGESYAFGSQKFLIPYETINNQLNAYGKEVTAYASNHNDEPKIKKTTSDYIFSNSSTAYLTGEDLLLADKTTLRLARNEIYARHGRKFNSTDLQEYFNQKNWYTPTTDSDSFDENGLNKFEKKNLAAIKTAEEQLKSKKIENGFVALTQDQIYMLDLDGDGNNESISWTKESKDEYSSTLKLSINGQKQSCLPVDEHNAFRMNALDLKKGDGEIELHIEALGDSDMNSSSFFRFHDGKLLPIADLSGDILNSTSYLYRYRDLIANGNGVLAIRADTPLGHLQTSQFGCYYVDLLYSYRNGKLEEIPQDIYSLKYYKYTTEAFQHNDDNRFYIVSNEFTVMKEKGGNTPAFQAKPGETVCPVAWSLQGEILYVLVMNEAGSCGWVKDIPLYFDVNKDYYQYVPAWG